MNIICNNCGGADFYNLYKQQFKNPFMWSCIFADDMISLIQKYDTINFNNIDFKRLTADIANTNHFEYNEKLKICGITVDNTFMAYYTHYIFGPYRRPIKRGPDILYYRNFEYVYNKYNERLHRMTEEPIFIIIAFKRHGWNIEKINKLLSIKSTHKVILITNKKCSSKDKKFDIIYDTNLDKKEKEPPIIYIKKYFKRIIKAI